MPEDTPDPTPDQPSSQTSSKTPDHPPSSDAPAWSRLHLWQMQPVRDVLLALGVFGIFWLGQKTSIVTVPVLLAILLAYLFEPVIQFATSRLKMSRQGAVVSIIVGVVLVVVVPSVIGATYGVAQAVTLGSSLVEKTRTVSQTLETTSALVPETDAERLEQARESLRDSSGDAWVWIYDQIRAGREDEEAPVAQVLERITDYFSDEQRAQQVSQAAAGALVDTVRGVAGFSLTLFSLLFTGFITAFFFYFLATQWVQFKHWVSGLLPDKQKETIVDLAGKFDVVVSGFVRGRITIAFVQAIVFSLGYWAIGVPAAFILGPVVAILSIVPYLALVGLPISVGLLWLEGHAGFRGHILWVLGAPIGFYFVGQALDDYVLTPLIQGKETGLDTPMILFASLAGGALFGVFGLLIAIPIAACAKILIQEIVWPKFKEWAEGRASDPLPIE